MDEELPEAHVADNLARRPGHFTQMAQRITTWAGSPAAAVEVVLALLAWIGIGFLTEFSRWWEVAATVGLSFVTLLMLILIQHTQNHDDQSVQLKLDELIRANTNAANQMMRLEDSASHADLEQIRQSFNNEVAG
jgi:low affinity Fe/Cu permease